MGSDQVIIDWSVLQNVNIKLGIYVGASDSIGVCVVV